MFAKAIAQETSMEQPKSPQNLEQRASASNAEMLDGSVSLFLRLWSYGGPSQPPTGLAPEQDPEIATLIQDIVAEGKGQIAERLPELWSAHFDDAPHALSTAKILQQRFLTFHRKTEPQQVVPSVLIYRTKSEQVSGPDSGAPEDMLANVTSAQILIADSIYEQMKSVPGFKFNPKPVREAGETFGPEAIYELLWTDESTYGHLRQASRAGLKTVGRYHIQEELGRGAMGAVYKAYDELIGRTVALKTISIDRDASNHDEIIERLKQEAKAAGGLDHPNIITIYDVGQEGDIVYLSMQFVKGITLATLLAEVGIPSLPTFLSWADQISDAVGFAHARGVVHRDLKPANLMVTEQGVIKVLDFGIAKIENTSLTQTGLVVGTPSYMAPEQVAGKKTYHRADIFALGSVFYELVTREKPFRGDITTILYKIAHEEPVAPSLINPAIPGGIDAVIRKALAKDPKERFQTCEEMRKAFLEQASRMKGNPAAVAPVGAVVARAESRVSPPVPRFLLEQAAPKRPLRVGRTLAMALLGGVVAATGWASYVKSHTGSYPPLAGKLRGAVQNVPQTIDSMKKSVARYQPERGDQSSPGAAHDALNTGTSSSMQLPVVPSHEVEAPIPTTAESSETSTTTPRGPAGGESRTDQSLSEGARASVSSLSTPSTSAEAPASQGSSAVQTGISPSPVSLGSADRSAAQLRTTSAPATMGDATNSPVSSLPTEAQSDGAASAANALSKPRRPPALSIDGFSRKNIPELLRAAEDESRRRDYRLASYTYKLILKLDHSNIAARQGLRLAEGTEQLH